MKTFEQFLDENKTVDSINSQVQKHVDAYHKHVQSYNAGKMDADTLGSHAVKAIDKIAKVRGVDHESAKQIIYDHTDKHIREDVDLKNYYGHHGELRPASDKEKAKKAELIQHHTAQIAHHKGEMKKAEDAEDWDAYDKHEKQMKLHSGHLSNVRTYMKG